MTADLAAWLLADDGPIATDEDDARAAAANGPLVLDYEASAAQREFIDGWDPARVLAECAAKRQIIAAHAVQRGVAYDKGYRDCSTCGGYEHIDWPCPTLLALAQPYAGRPGWRDEWATT